MEYGLWRTTQFVPGPLAQVLILVLMEYGLWQTKKTLIDLFDGES